MASMDLTEIKNWDVRDLNHALMATIMAQQLERGNTLSSTDKTTVLTKTTAKPDNLIEVPVIMDETGKGASDTTSGVNQIVTGSVLVLLEVLMIVAYFILINHNKIDYRKRMIYILILIVTRK